MVLLCPSYMVPKRQVVPKRHMVQKRYVVPKRRCMTAAPGFNKSQHQSSSATAFPTPPTIGHSCQQSCIFPALLGCHGKSRQVWPMVWSQSPPSSYTGSVTRGVASQLCHGLKSLPSPWLKAWPQLFNISMNSLKDYRYVK